MWMDEQATFEPGARIGDVWEVTAPLGRGGMGSVYACRNKDAHSIRVAIKMLQGFAEFHPIARKRFLREAEILYSLDHPNVVKVTNIVLDGRPPYIEMELVAGHTLASELLNGPMAVERVVEVAAQLTDALAYMHRRRVYHRDIKPDNVLIQADGALKLVDFGLAKEAEGLELTLAGGRRFGTVEYCPPEWIHADRLDPAAWDRYALGVLLYEMLTGRSAFPLPPGDSATQVLEVMAAKQALPYLELGAGFPILLQQVVRDLTRLEPEARMTDLRVVAAAFHL